MALINCPECNHEISDQAKACPHCGCPVKKKVTRADEQTKKNVKVFALILGAAILVVAAILLFGGQSKGKPDDISSQHYQYALKAIEYVDQYLDYEISVYEAYNLLKDLESQSALPETEHGDATYYKNYVVEFNVWVIQTDLFRMYSDSILDSSDSTDYYDEILESRNEIAEMVGEKKRRG